MSNLNLKFPVEKSTQQKTKTEAEITSLGSAPAETSGVCFLLKFPVGRKKELLKNGAKTE